MPAAPTDRLFEQFRERFPAIPVDIDNLRLWPWPDDFPAQPYTFLTARAVEVRSWAQQYLLEGLFDRDDYRELCELVIKYLGGQVSVSIMHWIGILLLFRCDLIIHGGLSVFQVVRQAYGRHVPWFVMRAPGALHHARFLASALYILKMAMLGDVLPPGIVTPVMRDGIDRMAQYIALFHAPWFLQARLPLPSPRLDLQMWKHMTHFEVNKHTLKKISSKYNFVS